MLVAPTKQVCRKCGVELTEDNWYSWAKDNNNRECKDCVRARMRKNNKAWKENNPERYKEYQQSPEVRKQQREYHKERYHADGRVKAYLKKWREEHPEYQKEWRKRRAEEKEKVKKEANQSATNQENNP